MTQFINVKMKSSTLYIHKSSKMNNKHVQNNAITSLLEQHNPHDQSQKIYRKWKIRTLEFLNHKTILEQMF